MMGKEKGTCEAETVEAEVTAAVSRVWCEWCGVGGKGGVREIILSAVQKRGKKTQVPVQLP
jgi:hypothetical protein